MVGEIQYSTLPESNSSYLTIDGWKMLEDEISFLGWHLFRCHVSFRKGDTYPSKIEPDLTNGPLSKLLELLDTQV